MLARRGMTVRWRSGRAGPTGVARAGLCWRRLTPGGGKCKGVGALPHDTAEMVSDQVRHNDDGNAEHQILSRHDELTAPPKKAKPLPKPRKVEQLSQCVLLQRFLNGSLNERENQLPRDR